MKNLLCTLIIAIMADFAFTQDGTITNVISSQRTDGSMIIDIYYDMDGPEPAYTITCEVSFNAGSTFTPFNNVTGDAGEGISPGTGKYIIWNFGAEFPGQYSNQMQVKIIANSSSSWTCGSLLIDQRDGQSYSTVPIGTQCWMAQNLNIGTMVPGSSSQLDNSVIEKYCYGNITANCNVYGGLYQWNEMMQYVTTSGTQGICPAGWHLPTDAEWCTLEQYVDATISCNTTWWRGVDGGGKLKEAGYAHWHPDNIGATNSSGFTALPGGARYANGSFNNLSFDGYFWTSDEDGSFAWFRGLTCDGAEVNRETNGKAYGLSLRCLQD